MAEQADINRNQTMEQELLEKLMIFDYAYGGYELKKGAAKVVIQALSEVRKYRAIGTVEECRSAREKQIAKKPEKGGEFYWIDTVKIHGRYREVRKKAYHNICPCCKNNVTIAMEFCNKCAQKLDWRIE